MKYFIVSDIHSFYDEMMAALKKAGYQKRNKDHHLVVLGDVFDRGPKAIELYKYLTSIPKHRLSLVKGNHEQLYLDLLKKSFPDSYDFSNGTVDTFCQIAGYDAQVLAPWYWYKEQEKEPWKKCQEAWREIQDIVKYHPITAWLKDDKIWKNYVEIGDFIGVHAFIPKQLQKQKEDLAFWFPSDSLPNDAFEPFPNWRTEATATDWENAAWVCPYAEYLAGFFDLEKAKGKRLICGHWHAYDFRIHIDGITYSSKDDIDFSPYISQDLIAIDACTAMSKIVNVLVIENNKVLN